jgi:dTDP-4-dehydrorhamnose reductase
MLRLAETQDVVRVVADQYGSPTAGADLARALLDIAARRATAPSEASGIYHLAGTGETSWHGLAEAIFAGWARRGHRVPHVEPISMAEWPSPAQRPPYSALDCRKVECVFGIRLPCWEESVDRCLDAIHRTRTEVS